MRSEIFLIGIILIIIGPVLVALALSSCLGTILSGHFLACVSDFAYLIIGGAFFVTGIVTAFIGVFAPDPTPQPVFASPTSATLAGVPGSQISCRKCGRTYDSGQFFCPSCGQRRA